MKPNGINLEGKITNKFCGAVLLLGPAPATDHPKPPSSSSSSSSSFFFLSFFFFFFQLKAKK